MSTRTYDEALAELSVVRGELGYGDEAWEEWEAGHGLTGVMLRDPSCKLTRRQHASRKIVTCGCLGPVTGVGRFHATRLLAMMCTEPGIATPVAPKPVMGWNHVTTFTSDAVVKIPTAKQVRYRR